jgi:ATP-binding cassette subfamily B protein
MTLTSTTTASAAANQFSPVAIESLYPPPKATISSDKSKTWLHRALPLVKAHRGIFSISLILSFVALVMQVQIPNLVKHAIDNAISAQTTALRPYVWWIVGLAVGRGILSYVSRRLLLETGYAIEFDLRNGIYEHLTRMSFSFYDKVQSGQLISRANSDIRRVQMYLTFAPSIIVQCAIAVVAFIEMLSINVTLALVAMVTMPFIYIVGIHMRRVIFPVSWLIQARLADVATIVDENINGVRVVKSFAAEQNQLSQLQRAADKLQWGYIKDADVRGKWAPTMENLPRVGLALVLLYGGWMALHGHATIGTIVAFNSYVLMLQPPFRMLGMLIMMGQRASASAQRIYEILDEQPDIVDKPDAVDLLHCDGDVRFEHVDFDYPSGTRVLRDFDVHVRPGETVAIVGRTGTGKSTVARLVNRFYDVTAGTVRIDGHDVRDLTVASLRSKVGIVLDEPFLFSVSIRDNIAYGRPDADMDDVIHAAKAAGAHKFITALEHGYDTVVGERGYTLSGGQRQRVAIARTLLMNPPILILDDATSAIDVQVEQRIHAALNELMTDRTTLIIAHRLSTISLAHRVLLMDEGRVIADGTHDDLLANEPRYRQVLAQLVADEEAAAAQQREEGGA